MVPLEETEYATGFNNGLREALRVVDARIKSTDMKDIDQISLDDLRLAYRELREQDERQKERTQGAMADLRSKGEKTGGQVPYGYRTGRDERTLIEDEREQAVIALVRQLSADGDSIRVIIGKLWGKELWGKKIRARVVPNQEPLKNRRIGEFDSMQIRRMLKPSRQVRELKKMP